jgi:biopolymer transport protein ExbB
MGNPSNFEGGNIETGTPLNILGQVYHGGAVVPVLLGIVNGFFSIERFVISKKQERLT